MALGRGVLAQRMKRTLLVEEIIKTTRPGILLSRLHGRNHIIRTTLLTGLLALATIPVLLTILTVVVILVRLLRVTRLVVLRKPSLDALFRVDHIHHESSEVVDVGRPIMTEVSELEFLTEAFRKELDHIRICDVRHQRSLLGEPPIIFLQGFIGLLLA